MSFSLRPYTPPDFSRPELLRAPDVKLAPCPRDGVAPDGYHAMSIFPEYLKQGGVWREAVNSEGYMEVGGSGVVLFAQTCEWPEDIDRSRAERSRRQAEEMLRQSHSQAQFRANQIMLARAMARLRNSRTNINNR